MKILQNLIIAFAFSSIWNLTFCTTVDPESYISTIQEFLSTDSIEENITYIDSLTATEDFIYLDCYTKGKIYHYLGVSYYLLLDEDSAIHAFEELALKSWEGCSSVPLHDLANTIYNIGISYQYTDRRATGKTYIDQAMVYFTRDTTYNVLKLANKLIGAGNFYIDLNDVTKSEAYFQSAVRIFTANESDLDKIFEIYNNLSVLHIRFKNYAKAKQYFIQSIEIVNTNRFLISELEKSFLLINGAISYFHLGELDEAKSLAVQGITNLDKTENPLLYSIGLEILGSIEQKYNNDRLAIDYFQRVLKIRKASYPEKISNTQLSNAYEDLSYVHFEVYEIEKAKKYLQESIETLVGGSALDVFGNPVLKQYRDPTHVDLIRLLSFKASRLLQDKHLDKELFNQTLYKIDTLITRTIINQNGESSKIKLFDLIQKNYGHAVFNSIKASNKTGDDQFIENAYYFSSKSKSLVLQNQLYDKEIMQSSLDSELLETEIELEKQKYKLEQQLNTGIGNLDSIYIVYNQVSAEFEVFLDTIELKIPSYYRAKYEMQSAMNYREIMESLKDDVALIEYSVISNELDSSQYIQSFWITRDTFFTYQVDYNKELRQAISSFNEYCRNPSLPVDHSNNDFLLATLLNDGLHTLGTSYTKIFIVPDSELHNLSFDALRRNGRYLIQDFAFEYLYSSSFQTNAHVGSEYKTYVGFGANYNKGLNKQLKEENVLVAGTEVSMFTLSSQEIIEAAALFSGKSYTNKQASLNNFQVAAGDKDILHLSLHGIVNYENPSNSCIIFDNSYPDFILRATDLYHQNLNSNLVILSSCSTASGKIYTGEGVQGMSKAFILAGSKYVLSSLWNAKERTSKNILLPFLKKTKSSNRLAENLQEAKINYLESHIPSLQHPYYWANYILIGQLIDGHKQSFPILPFLIVGFTIILLFILKIYYFKRDV